MWGNFGLDDGQFVLRWDGQHPSAMAINSRAIL
jgi:hypothetical protein